MSDVVSNFITRKISHDEAISVMELKKSAGMPFSRGYKGCVYKSKQEVFDAYGHEWLMKAFDTFHTVEIPWTSFIKEEIISSEKIANNKSRQINVGPLVDLYVATRLCHFFNECMVTTHLVKDFALGMDVFSEWRNLVLKFEYCSRVYVIDYSGWDSTMTPQLLWLPYLWRIMQRDESLTDDDIRRMHEIYHRMIYSPVALNTGVIVRTHGGMKSGFKNTTPDNSMLNSFILRYAWLKKFPRKKFNLEVAVLGDDLTYGIYKHDLTPDDLRKAASDFGVVVKDGWKAVDSHNVEFLSRKTVLYKGTYASKSSRPDKMLANLYFSNEFDVVNFFNKICGIRVALFLNRKEYALVNSMALHFIKQYNIVDTSPYLSLSKLIYLYTGRESAIGFHFLPTAVNNRCLKEETRLLNSSITCHGEKERKT